MRTTDNPALLDAIIKCLRYYVLRPTNGGVKIKKSDYTWLKGLAEVAGLQEYNGEIVFYHQDLRFVLYKRPDSRNAGLVVTRLITIPEVLQQLTTPA